MIKLKTSQERKRDRQLALESRNAKIAKRFEMLTTKCEYSISDAATICANEFNLSLPTIYKARKAYGM